LDEKPVVGAVGGDFVASEKLLKLLNKGIARELQVSIQYMWQHIMTKGIHGAVVEDIFREIAIEEMKHAEVLAERVAFLNGIPTVEANAIHIGTDALEMLKDGVQYEEEAVSLYKQAIQVAEKEGDFGTRHMLEEILSAEEKHLDRFGKLLVGMTSPFTQP
jgi:bacterioferritin